MTSSSQWVHCRQDMEYGGCHLRANLRCQAIFADIGIPVLSEIPRSLSYLFPDPSDTWPLSFSAHLVRRLGEERQCPSDAIWSVHPSDVFGREHTKGRNKMSLCVCGVCVRPAHVALQAQLGLMFVLPVNKSVDL